MKSPLTHKPTLYLHVGYGKTGSTAIQHWLVSQRKSLEDAGIIYPIPDSGVGDSGNGILLLDALAKPNQRPDWLSKISVNSDSCLFSREQFAREFSESNRCEQLAEWAESWGFGSVQILLFVRNPREHCYSLWAQKVKRAGETRSLQSFAASYDVLVMANRFLEKGINAGFVIQVCNYSTQKSKLLEVILAWLASASPKSSKYLSMQDHPSSLQVINPTPTKIRLSLQRMLNKLPLHIKLPRQLGMLERIMNTKPNNSKNISAEIALKWNAQLKTLNNTCARCQKIYGEPLKLE